MNITLSDAKIPDGERVYAIGDVHGCIDEFDWLLAAVEKDLAARPVKKHQIIFLGDYIDRGPDSKTVIDRLIKLEASGKNIITLKGNHEDKFLNFFANPAALADQFFAYGGLDTLRSYGIDDVLNTKPGSDPGKLRGRLLKSIPKKHLKFFNRLKLSATVGDYFFCHAGIRPGVKLKNQNAHDLMWIRYEFLESQEPYKKVIVHGHTPQAAPQVNANRINVDTKCYDSGILTCLVLEGRDHRFIQTSR